MTWKSSCDMHSLICNLSTEGNKVLYTGTENLVNFENTAKHIMIFYLVPGELEIIFKYHYNSEITNKRNALLIWKLSIFASNARKDISLLFMRNQPIATTKDKLENHDFKTMINGVLGSLRDASKDPEGRKMESRLGNALRPPWLGFHFRRGSWALICFTCWA